MTENGLRRGWAQASPPRETFGLEMHWIFCTVLVGDSIDPSPRDPVEPVEGDGTVTFSVISQMVWGRYNPLLT